MKKIAADRNYRLRKKAELTLEKHLRAERAVEPTADNIEEWKAYAKNLIRAVRSAIEGYNNKKGQYAEELGRRQALYARLAEIAPEDPLVKASPLYREKALGLTPTKE